MAEQKFFLARRWKLILNVVTLVALAAFVFGARKNLIATFHNLAHINAWTLLLLLPIEALNYHAQAKLYQGMFKIVGNSVPYRFLYKMSVELNFVNHTFPSGGAAGISYFSLRLRNGEITAAKATLMHLMKVGLGFLSYELLLIIGMISLSVMGRVNNLTILVGTALSTFLLIATFGFVYIVGSQARINQFFTSVTKLINRIIQLVRPQYPETISIDRAREVFDDFHTNYKQLERSLPQLKAPFWYALLANVTEILAVYVVFVAYGRFVNIGAIILAYGVANFAGAVSVLPGGVGVYEFLMTAVLVSAGVPADLSLPVIIMYRVVNTLIQVPPGYVLYQRTLSRNPDMPREY